MQSVGGHTCPAIACASENFSLNPFCFPHSSCFHSHSHHLWIFRLRGHIKAWLTTQAHLCSVWSLRGCWGGERNEIQDRKWLCQSGTFVNVCGDCRAWELVQKLHLLWPAFYQWNCLVVCFREEMRKHAKKIAIKKRVKEHFHSLDGNHCRGSYSRWLTAVVECYLDIE